MQKRVMFIAILLLAICNKIVGADGVDQLTISDFIMSPGDTKAVGVALTNQDTYVGFQFDLYLPDGFTVESFTATNYRIPEGTTPQMAQQSDGSYRFVAASLERNPIMGNSGTVLMITVKAADNIATNAYTGYLRNIKISKADGSGIVEAEQSFVVTVKDKVWSVIGTINGDWDTDTEMTSTDGVNYTATIPYLAAGTYEYKIRANGIWDENYGLNGEPGGQNIPVTVPEDNTGVVITFNAQTKEISNSLLPPVYSITGSGPGLDNFSGWLAWTQDADMTKGNDGRYSVTFNDLLAGDYLYKVRVNHEWTVDYGVNGEPGGANIQMTVPSDNMPVTIYFDPSTKLTTTSVDADSLAVAYAVLDGTTLTFYYDKQKAARNGMDIGPFTSSNLRPWYSSCRSITMVTFDASFADYRPTSTAYWFDSCSSLTSITGIENLKTDSVTTMEGMFWGCSSLTSLDVSKFNTASVTSMRIMFMNCTGLTSLDVSGFNTQNVTDMYNMFYLCRSLTNLDVSRFNTASVKNMGGMFSGCSGLTSLDLSTFNTTSVTDMGAMFHSSKGLTSLDLSGFNTANVTDMGMMFFHCSGLTTIYVGEGWSTSKVENGGDVFNDCTSLVGGMGTVYDENHVEADYAHIDGGTANPGYFTPKNGYGQAATPTFTHDGNLVFAHSTTEGATIRYTIDGEVPADSTGIVYSDSIRVTRNCTIRAIAIRENFTPSEVAEYNVDWFKVANVEFVQNGHTITLTTQTDSATIHYTLSNDAAGEQIYTAPLTLDADCTIEAYATRDGYTPSDTTSFVFHADGVTCSNPVFARNGNAITITTLTPEAQIYYTTDGTDPTAQSLLYADSIVVANNMTIKAIVMRENYYPSQVTTFVVDWFKCETPTYAWNGDNLSLATATDGASINYWLSDEDVNGDGFIDAQDSRTYTNPVSITRDVVINAFARKDGWNSSDTLVIDYPYSAWQELLIAVDEANRAIQQAAGNDNVPQQMLNELKALTDEAQTMYRYRDAEEVAIKDKTVQIRDLTDAVLRLANAQDEPYAVLTGDTISGMTLTFYYDKKKQERSGMGVGPFADETQRGWHSVTKNITQVIIDASMANDTTLTSTAYWFEDFFAITSIEGLENLNTTNVTNMNSMFNGCIKITSLSIPFSTVNVTDMGEMFFAMDALVTLDVSGMVTDNVTDMNAMFSGDKNLRNLGITNFNTSKVGNMSWMFGYCESLESINLSHFSTASATNLYGMFDACSSLTSLDLSTFDTQNVVRMSLMFRGCSSLTALDLSSFDVQKVTDVNSMFNGCSQLQNIFVNNSWNMVSLSESEWARSDVFTGCASLVGGMGTVYDANHVDAEYARIDGGTAAPGYFTDINSGVAIYVQASEAPYLYAFDAEGNALNGEFPGNQMADTVMVNGQTFWKTRIYRLVPFNINILDAQSYRTREIYVISDRYFVYEGQSKYTDVTARYIDVPEIQISSLALPGSHNGWDKTQQFDVVEAGKKYTKEVDLTNVTMEDNLFQFKLFANACAWLGITSLTLDAPSYVYNIGDPAMFTDSRNFVMDLSQAPTRKFLFEAIWSGGYQMEEGWTLKITEATPTEQVETPSFSWLNDELSISTKTEGANIYYQLSDTDVNGDEVINDADYALYSTALTIQRDVIIRAYAEKRGMLTSDTLVLEYPYRAWMDLKDMFNIARSMFSSAENTNKVPEDLLSEMLRQSYIAEDMFKERMAGRGDIEDQASILHHLINEVNSWLQVVASYENGLLTVQKATTLAEALNKCDANKVNESITTIVWASRQKLTDSDMQAINNPNVLIYVTDESMTSVTKNVVVGNDSIGFTAKNIVLTDVTNGNGDFKCTQAFTAERISYTREFKQQTQVDVCRGWETIALPFAVQTVTHERNGVIAPFGNSASGKHFWLRQLTQSGLQPATTIEANMPYLISMPNNTDLYAADFNQSGRVTFTAENAAVPITTQHVTALADSTILFVPTTMQVGRSSDVWALNVGQVRGANLEGSVFERDFREVRPFEAYTVHRSNTPAPRFVPINDINGGNLTGISDASLVNSEKVNNEKWYDLNGRQLQQKPTKGGVYILNGKKVVLR